MNNKSLIKMLVEAFDFGKLKPKNQTVLQSTMTASIQKMNEYNQERVKTVDLGLPSGTLWCKFNVGAENESELESGDYFAWGETEPKDEYSLETYKFGTVDNLIKYNEDDKLSLLLPEDDAATVNMGKYWKTPTAEQCQELIDNTTHEWVKDYKSTGIKGILLTSKTNGNTLFFHAAGYIEDDVIQSDTTDCCICASELSIAYKYIDCYGLDLNYKKPFVSCDNRYGGCNVRAVFNG